jgi:parallel beta-helix repeat protein
VRPAADDTRIERSGRVELPQGVLRDARGDGVLQIAGEGITVELAGELRGAAEGEAADGFTGVGIRVTGKNVTLRGARVAGFKVGIHAVGADGLVLEDCDVSGNFRQRLKSTKEKEAEEDWLNPHANDGREWFTSYGAGIYVERASGVTVRRCRARAGQNGLVLDRCEKATVYDNDFSFLSGWGIALWRSSDNVIARNACDFCIRGYSHGVYNRGQDSAGILLFEQCSRNVIAENSATHCGDGFFAFAGQEALGGVPPPAADFDYTGRGCNQNRIVRNDFSYAAAHGLELTFSFGNEISENRLVGNAICGIWGGYSRGTRIERNTIEDNGAQGYGLERGGVNIEHGQENAIRFNKFRGNACGVHLWWDEDSHLAELPWVRANGHASRDEILHMNWFDADALGVHLRGSTSVLTSRNRFLGVPKEFDAGAEAQVRVSEAHDQSGEPLVGLAPGLELPGTARPVGARPTLRAREKIVIDAWGPVEPR